MILHAAFSISHSLVNSYQKIRRIQSIWKSGVLFTFKRVKALSTSRSHVSDNWLLINGWCCQISLHQTAWLNPGRIQYLVQTLWWSASVPIGTSQHIPGDISKIPEKISLLSPRSVVSMPKKGLIIFQHPCVHAAHRGCMKQHPICLQSLWAEEKFCAFSKTGKWRRELRH